MSGVTPDAGGLIALKAQARGLRVTIPATALAQVMRNPARQARLSRLIRNVSTDLIPLDGPSATAAGLLLARTGTADIVDAHVVVCAEQRGQSVVTSDPGDLRRLSAKVRLVTV